MAISFSGVVTPTSIIFATPAGKMVNVSSAHVAYQEIKNLIKQLQVALNEGHEEKASKLHQQVSALADTSRTIARAGKGRVEVSNGIVRFDGEIIHGAITDRILWGLTEGFDMQPYILFLTNLMNNPSKRAVDELYGFIEKSAMGITNDGYIIAYKRVTADYLDIHSKTFDNSVGSILEMPRNKVDDDRHQLCSYGFHFCSFSYLGSFGSASRGDRIVIVKVNPADIVSIPADYNDAKARTCRYEVIGEYEGDDKNDILSTRAVWSGGSDWAETISQPDTEDEEWESSDEDWEVSDWESSDEDDEDEPADDAVEVVPVALDIVQKVKQDAQKRIFFQATPPQGSIYNVWYNIADGNARYDWFDSIGWRKTEISPAYGPLDDIGYRLARGSSIKKATYYHCQNIGVFKRVVLSFDDGSEVAVFDEGALPNVDAAIAQSPGHTAIRMVLQG